MNLLLVQSLQWIITFDLMLILVFASSLLCALQIIVFFFKKWVFWFEVEIKSGEEDEEVLFKARAKLYRWDSALGQWKERGVGDIKILCQPQKCYYRVLMRRDQVFKVCANHSITTAMKLKPSSSSSNTLVWTATDYSGNPSLLEVFSLKKGPFQSATVT